MNTHCPPKRVLSPARFFTLCRLTVQLPQSYSVGGQRSSGQLTGKSAGALPDYRGRWCAVSRGHPGRPNPPMPRATLGQLSATPWELPSTVGCGIAWIRTRDIQAIERILHFSECFYWMRHSGAPGLHFKPKREAQKDKEVKDREEECRLRARHPRRFNKPSPGCLLCDQDHLFANCPFHCPYQEGEGELAQEKVRRRRQRGGKVRRKQREPRWCTMCIAYGHEDEDCPEQEPEDEEPERPAHEWEAQLITPSLKTGVTAAGGETRGRSRCVLRLSGRSPNILHLSGRSLNVLRLSGRSPNVLRPSGRSPNVLRPSGRSPNVLRLSGRSPNVLSLRGRSRCVHSPRGRSQCVHSPRGRSRCVHSPKGRRGSCFAWGRQGSCFAWGRQGSCFAWGRYTMARAP
ncbi:UNVERIFIED_CONTAM: hypothetical protein FKN15_007177 [Acipenser sinensis]